MDKCVLWSFNSLCFYFKEKASVTLPSPSLPDVSEWPTLLDTVKVTLLLMMMIVCENVWTHNSIAIYMYLTNLFIVFRIKLQSCSGPRRKLMYNRFVFWSYLCSACWKCAGFEQVTAWPVVLVHVELFKNVIVAQNDLQKDPKPLHMQLYCIAYWFKV